jgi:hypothetical protein
MPPTKATNAEEQMRLEKKRFEKKMQHKNVLGEKLMKNNEKEENKFKERFNSGD